MTFPLEKEKYKLINEVGFGPHSNVYEALCTENSQRVCVKKINLIEFPFNTRSLQAVLATWNKNNCPYILEYYGSFIDGEYMWIIQEFMDAGSLIDLINKSFPNGCKNEKLCAAIAHNVLKSLSYFHSNNRNHCNLKASNVLFNHKGEIKLSDFNISTSIVQTGKIRQSLISMNNDVIYLAPEILNNGTYSSKSDIWSFGLLMLNLANGHHPYEGIKVMEAVVKIMNNDSPSLNDDFSPEFKEFIAGCLDKNPVTRLSADELLQHKFLQNIEPNQLASFLHFSHTPEVQVDHAQKPERHGRFLITRKPSIEIIADEAYQTEHQLNAEITLLTEEVERLEEENRKLIEGFNEVMRQIKSLA